MEISIMESFVIILLKDMVNIIGITRPKLQGKVGIQIQKAGNVFTEENGKME
jgi:hypothetical protein